MDKQKALRIFDHIRNKNLNGVKQELKDAYTQAVLMLPFVTVRQQLEDRSLIKQCTLDESYHIMEYLIQLYIQTAQKYILQNKYAKSTNVCNQKFKLLAQQKAEENVKFWVNQYSNCDPRQQSLMHLACSRGNKECIRVLQKYGADLNAQTELGETPLHLAASMNQAFSISFLQYHGANIDCLNVDSQTPLHVACSQINSIDAIYYLKPHKKALDWQDKNGKTPLHLLVQTGQYNSEWACKYLICNGANKHIKDFEGNLPIDIINENLYDLDTQEKLQKIVRISVCCKQGYDLNETSYKEIVFYLTVMILTFILLQLFVFPYQPFSKYVLSLNSLYIISNIFYAVTFFKHPIYIQKQHDYKFYELLDQNDSRELCPICEVKTYQDSQHCYNCGKCFDGFHFHSNWYLQCVDTSKYPYFLLFIVTLDIYLIIIISLCFSNIQFSITKSDLDKCHIHNLLGFGKYCKSDELGWFLKMFNVKKFFNSNQRDQAQIWLEISWWIVLIPSIVYACFLTIIFLFELKTNTFQQMVKYFRQFSQRRNQQQNI